MSESRFSRLRRITILSLLAASMLMLATLPTGSAGAGLLLDCAKEGDPEYPCTKTPEPSYTPTDKPTEKPTAKPTAKPTSIPPNDTPKPTVLGPTNTPTSSTTPTPTFWPSLSPSPSPTQTFELPEPDFGGPVGDIWVYGIEVTQATQVYPGNLIPLIAYKRTVVRVYVQSREDGGPWDDVTARLTVTGSGGVGRVLLPITANPSSTITVSPDGSHRSTLDDSFNFLLPIELTAVGAWNLQVDIYSISGRFETLTSNNRMLLGIRFNPIVNERFYGVNFGLDGSDPASPRRTPAPWTDFEAHRSYAENVLPVTRLFLNPFPGVGTAGRYFANLEAARAWADMMKARPEYSGRLPDPDFTIIYLLEPFSDGNTGQEEWCRINGQNTRGVSAGVTMAHELSHCFWAGWHPIYLPDHPAQLLEDIGRGTIHAFPYGHASIGQQVGMNTFTYPFRTVPPVSGAGHVHDYMGYGNPPSWTSPYTYCRLIDLLMPRFPCPAAARTASILEQAPEMAHNSHSQGLALIPALKEQEFIYIAGSLDSDGTAVFLPFFTQISEEELSTRLQGNRYHLRFEDGAGVALAEYTFEPLGYDADPTQAVLFSMTVPFNSSTARILLLDGEIQLADRAATQNSPVVHLLSPEGGTQLSGLQTVSWDATDIDGDDLTYLVEYSPDGGERWIPLDANLTTTNVQIDFDALPGSDQALLRVVASDGVNTSEDVIAAQFTVPTHSPEITLHEPLEGASFFETQPFYINATAFDWEDGAIEDNASYVWVSNVDGKLSVGPWTALAELTSGDHTLTIQVTDSDGNVSEASVHVNIMAVEEDQTRATENPTPATNNTPLSIAAGIVAVALIVLVFLLSLRSRQAKNK